MPLKVRRWYRKELYILPELTDDRESLPPELVRNLTAWMDSRKPEFVHEAMPTNQVIHVDSATRFLKGDGSVINGVYKHQESQVLPGETAGRTYEFECGTAEILFRKSKQHPIESRTEWLYARCIKTNKCVVGPLLRYRNEEAPALPVVLT